MTGRIGRGAKANSQELRPNEGMILSLPGLYSEMVIDLVSSAICFNVFTNSTAVSDIYI